MDVDLAAELYAALEGHEEDPNLLRFWREWRGMSQREVGAQIGCSARYISYMERGRTSLDLRWMAMLARVLDVGIEDLMPLGKAPDGRRDRAFMWLYRQCDSQSKEALYRVAEICAARPPGCGGTV